MTIETQPMCDTQIAALTYIDTLGGREFTTKEIAEKIFEALIKVPGVNRRDMEENREIAIKGAIMMVLHLLGVQDPYEDEAPVELPEGRSFLTFSRIGRYGYDAGEGRDYDLELSHVDFGHATEEHKMLSSARDQAVPD